MIAFIKKIENIMSRYTERGVDDYADNNIVVSLTSYPPRMPVIHISLFSLLTQTLKPQKVILWLAHEQFPGRNADLPKAVLKLQDLGLEIRWTHDIRSYKKLVPTWNEYAHKTIVTADDDTFYPPNWLETLYTAHAQSGFKQTVFAHRAHHITFDAQGKILPYSQWVQHSHNTIQESFLNFATGVGGILYPPSSLHADVLREDVFMRIAPTGDDIFFWGMTLLKGSPISLSPTKIVSNFDFASGGEALWHANFKELNDQQLCALFKEYPTIAEKIEKARKSEEDLHARLAKEEQKKFSSGDYWEQRYRDGGNSGAGSYNRLMKFKAEILNNFIRENAVQSIADFGVGDGSQLAELQVAKYMGFDVSEHILAQVRQAFAHDKSKQFLHISEHTDYVADLAISLDVIYHLVEDNVFNKYMERLFSAASKYVVIYSSNEEGLFPNTTHVRHRKFTKWITENRPQWECIHFIKNKYPLRHAQDEQLTRSFSDFYIFSWSDTPSRQ